MRNVFSDLRRVRLNSRDMRTLLAVLQGTVSFSKEWDFISVQTIADFAHIGGTNATQRREARRSLRKLADAGLIMYLPGRGRGQLSIVGLPGCASSLNGKGGTITPLLAAQKGGVSDRKGGLFDNKKGGNGVRKFDHSEKYPRSISSPEKKKENENEMPAGGHPPHPPAPNGDKLLHRLAEVCTTERGGVLSEAEAVLAHCRRYVDDRLIDEAVGYAATLREKPRRPRYLVKVVQDRARNYGIGVPDFEPRSSARDLEKVPA